jgi:hypothetical protein
MPGVILQQIMETYMQRDVEDGGDRRRVHYGSVLTMQGFFSSGAPQPVRYSRQGCEQDLRLL